MELFLLHSFYLAALPSYSLLEYPLLHSTTLLLQQDPQFSGIMKFHVFSSVFPGKSNEIPGQFGSESQCLCW